MMSFKAISKLLKISYSWIKRILMELKISDLPGMMIDDQKQLHLRIDEHSFKHQEMVLIITDMKAKRVLGVLKDDRSSTLEEFLKKILAYMVREVCIDMKEVFRKLAQRLFPEFASHV